MQMEVPRTERRRRIHSPMGRQSQKLFATMELYPNIGNDVSGVRHVSVKLLSFSNLRTGQHLPPSAPPFSAAQAQPFERVFTPPTSQQPLLLVSVRNAAEARAALAGSAEVIDIKEPAHGPLGRAELTPIREIAQALGSFRAEGGCLTAALGELRDLTDFHQVAEIAATVDAVKIGLSGCIVTDWQARWRSLCEELTTPLIAVAYADWKSCGAPSPRDVIDAALASPSPGVLFDTYHKQGRTLFDDLPKETLRDLVSELHAAQRFTALAGRIDVAALEEIGEVGPEIIAVRSAVCRNGRNGFVDADLVATFRTAMRAKLVSS